MKILVHHDGKELGPFSLDEVRQGVLGGDLLPSDLAWPEGAPDWMPLSSIPGATIGADPMDPARRARTYEEAAAGLATASLVLGILAVCGCMLFLGIPAVICGHLARSKIRKAPLKVRGEGLALAGLITGYLGTFVTTCVLAAVAYGIFVVAKDSNHVIESIDQSEEIARACHTFAGDHGGKFPNTLDDLVPDYLQDQRWLADPGQSGSMEIGYYYFGSGHFESERSNNVLLASKAMYKHRHVVVHFDGKGHIENFTPPIEQ